MKNIVLIHGLSTYDNPFGKLIKTLPMCNVHNIHYNSYQSLELSLFECLDQLPEEPVDIIGYSLGGIIATLLAANFENIKSLTTISSPIGGSRAASIVMQFPGAFPIFKDLCINSKYIKFCKKLKLDIPTLSITSTGGSLPFALERNDGVVSCSSQRALGFAKHIEINANHFNILKNQKTISVINKHIFGNTL